MTRFSRIPGAGAPARKTRRWWAGGGLAAITLVVLGLAIAATLLALPASHAAAASVSSTTLSSSGTAKVAAVQKVVCIDPGHQAHRDGALEPIGPGSTKRKPKVESGTRSVTTGIPESQLVLSISLKLRDILQAHGVKVVMTRTTQTVDIPNSRRAKIANAAHADLFVRVHANGSSKHSAHGIEVLYPASIKGWTDKIAAVSKQAAAVALDDLVTATGARKLGLVRRSDLTGFNWSKVPVYLAEVGYMTNPAEDRLLETPAYQDKIANGLAKAILDYLGVG